MRHDPDKLVFPSAENMRAFSRCHNGMAEILTALYEAASEGEFIARFYFGDIAFTRKVQKFLNDLGYCVVRRTKAKCWEVDW